MQFFHLEMAFANNIPEDFTQILARIDELGGPLTYNHYPVGWAHAMNTPFQWTKQIASHFGGTRNGLVISWPARIKDKGGLRSQFHHVIDIAPTILEAAGVQSPSVLNGVTQKPVEGVSMVYSFDDAKAPTTAPHAYFEMFANRAIYNDGWVASTTAAARRGPVGSVDPEVDDYQVGALRRDRRLQPGRTSRTRNRRSCENCRTCSGSKLPNTTCSRSTTPRSSVSTSHPPQPHPRTLCVHLLRRHDAHPRRHGAGPEEQVVQDRRRCGYSRRRRGRGDRDARRTLQRLGPLPARRQAGVPLSLAGVQRFTVAGKEKLAPGKHVIVVDFKYDGGGIGKGATVTINVDDKPVAEGEWTVHMPFASRSTRPSTSARTPARPSARIITCPSSSPVN